MCSVVKRREVEEEVATLMHLMHIREELGVIDLGAHCQAMNSFKNILKSILKSEVQIQPE